MLQGIAVRGLWLYGYNMIQFTDVIKFVGLCPHETFMHGEWITFIFKNKQCFKENPLNLEVVDRAYTVYEMDFWNKDLDLSSYFWKLSGQHWGTCVCNFLLA